MITFNREQLLNMSRTVIRALGTPDDLARDVADSLVEANLVGHDSHGVLRLLSYAAAARGKQVQPDARPVLQEPPRARLAARRVDGNWGWGQPAARLATSTVIEVTRASGIGAVTIDKCNHVGRLGEYVTSIAEAGMVGLATCNVGRAVAPFGGRERLFGTNPIAYAVPRSAGQRPVLVDFATAGVAEGKLRVARAKGEQVPPGLVIDRDGRPSIEPAAFYEGGALLPFGGHKGYGLSVLADLLGGGLSGLGMACVPGFAHGHIEGNGTLIIAFNIADFVPLDHYLAQVDALCERVRASAPAEGFSEVLLPGDPEWRAREARVAGGVGIPEATWHDIQNLARELNVSV